VSTWVKATDDDPQIAGPITAHDSVLRLPQLLTVWRNSRSSVLGTAARSHV
jgi:hypothetical protein